MSHMASRGLRTPILQVMTDSPAAVPPELSARMAVAVASAQDRRERSGARMRPVLSLVLATIAVASLRGSPSPGWSGTHLGVTIALAGCLLTMGVAAAGRWPLETPAQRAALAVSIGGFGIALTALQQTDVSILPASTAVLTAFLYQRPLPAVAIGGAVTVGQLTASLIHTHLQYVNAASQLLLCAVLAVMAVSMRQAAQNQDRAELLLAQLKDAREAEAKAVALAERTRIAQELHDVLAQSLSGLAIQLEAARRLARRDRVSDELQELLERSGKLVKEGLSDARRAVGALRGDQLPSLDRLPELVERYRGDLELDATLTVTGTRRELPGEAGLALYRGAQEALTNAARYARGSQTLVMLCYQPEATVLTVEDRRTEPGPAPAPPVIGSGLGLTGMCERLAEVGGAATAGPTGQGWIVRMEIPA
jgi:signal transduction histidine kinase